MSHRAGFTLIEICLAIAISLLLLGLAIPSVVGLFSEQKLNATFERFDEMVHQAQLRSVSERRAFVLVFEKESVVLEPEQPTFEDSGKDWPRLSFAKDESVVLSRPVALVKKPAPSWVFWRSGTCEPVIATYQGPAGSWEVQYDALTARGTMLSQKFQ